MKVYWSFVLLLFIVWYRASVQYIEASWWSIFSANRTTHTPMMEQISLIKAAFMVLLFSALAYPIHQFTKKRN